MDLTTSLKARDEHRRQLVKSHATIFVVYLHTSGRAGALAPARASIKQAYFRNKKMSTEKKSAQNNMAIFETYNNGW